MFLVDSHCHLDLLNYNKIHVDINDVLKKSHNKYVKFFLSVSTSINNFNYLKNFTKNRINILLSCGIHPLNIISNDTNEFKLLKKNSENEKTIAIGETGLDYHYPLDNYTTQKKYFRQHIRISLQLKKPLLIHTRKSINDTIKILREEHVEQYQGIIHSFTETIDSARILLNMGFFISFSGIITFKNAHEVRETARFVPIERMLIETDSPYLSPVPNRGKENQPAFLYDIAMFIAKLKNINIATFSEITTNNFKTLFNLKSNLFK